MTRAHVRSRAGMRGQSMVEFAVAAAVLVPLLLMVPVLAKYVHTRQTVQSAARAAAWEATVSPDHALPATAQVRERLVERHFGRPSSAIRTVVAPRPDDDPVDSVMFNTWSGRPLVRRGDVVLRGYGDDAAPGLLGSAAAAVAAIPLGWDSPNARGLVTANLEVRPRNLVLEDGSPMRGMAPFDDIDLVFDARHALLADPWNASGPQGHARSVKTQVIPLVPTARLTTCEDVPGLVDGLPLPNLCPMTKIQEYLAVDIAGFSLDKVPLLGAIIRFQPGHIEPDVVPVDKLQPAP